jgi:uncharacterized membrane protein YidH (DUF202 family)
MKYIKKIGYILSGTFIFPIIALAQTGIADSDKGGDFGTLLGNLLKFANNTLIPFIIGIGFLVFVFGMFRYFIAGGANDEAKASGKSLMIYATLGFVLIIVFWGVINLLSSSTGLDGENIDKTDIKGITIPATNP